MFLNYHFISDDDLVAIGFARRGALQDGVEQPLILLDQGRRLEAALAKIQSPIFEAPEITADSVAQLDEYEKELLLRVCAAFGFTGPFNIILDSDANSGIDVFSTDEDGTNYLPPIPLIAARFERLQILLDYAEKRGRDKVVEVYNLDSLTDDDTSNPYGELFDLSDDFCVPNTIFEVAASNDSVSTQFLHFCNHYYANELKDAAQAEENNLLTRALFLLRRDQHPNQEKVIWIIENLEFNPYISQGEDPKSTLNAAALHPPILNAMLRKQPPSQSDIDFRMQITAPNDPGEPFFSATSLGVVAYYGHLDAVNNFLALGASVDPNLNEPDKSGYTALQIACVGRRNAETRPRGINLRGVDSHNAVSTKVKSDILGLLLDKTTHLKTIQRQDKDGKTALTHLLQGYQDLITNSKVEKSEFNLVVGMLKKLLRQGAGVGVTLPNQFEPFIESIRSNGHGDILNYFYGAVWESGQSVVESDKQEKALGVCKNGLSPLGKLALAKHIVDKEFVTFINKLSLFKKIVNEAAWGSEPSELNEFIDALSKNNEEAPNTEVTALLGDLNTIYARRIGVANAQSTRKRDADSAAAVAEAGMFGGAAAAASASSAAVRPPYNTRSVAKLSRKS